MPGLYVHIPYCRIKCRYCDFPAFSGQKGTIPAYLRALEDEGRMAGEPSDLRGDPWTLYVGGGTPSELSAREISGLFDAIGRTLPGLSFTEASFEANPESLDSEKLALLKGRGVTRISLGLQSAEDEVLKTAGRAHDASDFFKAFELARRAGAFALSVDLIHGLPGQDLESWKSGLRRVLSLGAEHLSIYGLEVQDQTVFSRLGVRVDEELGRRMLEWAVPEIRSRGYHHYEIANFAKPGFECLHNRGYWLNRPYLGLGTGAASYRGGVRSSNHRNLGRYLGAVQKGERPTAESEALTGRRRRGEEIMLGLRLIDGIDVEREDLETFAPSFHHLESRGLLAIDRASPGGRKRARLSPEGFFLANQVFAEFVEPFREAYA